MRTIWLWVLMLSITSPASAATVDPTEVWKPMYWLIGTWKGTSTGNEDKVTRVYASASTNHHIEITETGAGRSRAVWGMVSFDSQREALVLRQFATDGSTSDVAFDPAASTTGRVVFTSLDSEATRIRITSERTGAKTFVERIERSASGDPFAIVSETRFVRKD